MSYPINPNVGFDQNRRSLANSSDKGANVAVEQQSYQLANNKTPSAKESIVDSHKKQLNAAIIESSLKYSQFASDEPLSLLLTTALQGINEALNATGIDTSVSKTYESGIDYSPEATAKRIITFSTQYFGAYKEGHPEMSKEVALAAFVDIIGSGIEQGFTEAKGILEGLKVLDGDIASNIAKTYDLVQEGLQTFIEAFVIK